MLKNLWRIIFHVNRYLLSLQNIDTLISNENRNKVQIIMGFNFQVFIKNNNLICRYTSNSSIIWLYWTKFKRCFISHSSSILQYKIKRSVWTIYYILITQISNWSTSSYILEKRVSYFAIFSQLWIIIDLYQFIISDCVYHILIIGVYS